MGVNELLLLLATMAIAIAIVVIVAYRGFSGRRTGVISPVSISPVSTATEAVGSIQTFNEQTTNAPEFIAPAIESTPPVAEPVAATPEPVAIPQAIVATAAPEEAPPPFPEESTKTSIPTDVTAVANIASPTEIATPVLVIPAPKLKTPRASRKRLPTSATPGTIAPRRRRSSSKANLSPQVSAAPAATDQATPAEHQE